MPEEDCEADNTADIELPSPRSREGDQDSGPRRCRPSREQVLPIDFCLLVLPATFVVISVAKTPRELEALTETSTRFESAGRDCVQFADYSEGDVIESDHIIGTSNFTFMAWILPHTHYAFATDGNVEALEYPSAVDTNGWGSTFTSVQPLQLNREAHFAIVRRGLDCAMFVDGEHAVKGGWRRQNGPLVDLKYCEDKNLGVGFRHPRLPTLLSPGSHDLQDVFPGAIRGAALHVGVSFSEEQIRQGGHAFCE